MLHRVPGGTPRVGGQGVAVAGTTTRFLIVLGLGQPCVLEVAQSSGEHGPRRAGSFEQRFEPIRSEPEFADDQDAPTVPDQIEGAGERFDGHEAKSAI